MRDRDGVAMKLRRKLRRTIKWTGAVLAVLLLIVWLGSARYNLVANGPYLNSAAVSAGRLAIQWQTPWTSKAVTDFEWTLKSDSSTTMHWWFDSMTWHQSIVGMGS